MFVFLDVGQGYDGFVIVVKTDLPVFVVRNEDVFISIRCISVLVVVVQKMCLFYVDVLDLKLKYTNYL